MKVSASNTLFVTVRNKKYNRITAMQPAIKQHISHQYESTLTLMLNVNKYRK